MSEQELLSSEESPSRLEFAFVDIGVDIQIPSCRVTNWKVFMEYMETPSHRVIQRGMIYRGQRRHDWKLASSLSRLPRYENGYVPLSEREKLLKQFKLALRGRGPDFSSINNENEIWAYGQHYSLDTPLLDWSQSPFVALYFAFCEPDDDDEGNPDRAIFCLNKSKLDEIMPEIFYEPESNEHTRLVNQSGLFTITPDNEEGESFVSYVVNRLREKRMIKDNDAASIAPYFQKIHIPNINRTECLDMLRQMNIHHGSLFPDPFGAATYTNEWIRREHLRIIILDFFEFAKNVIGTLKEESAPIVEDLHENGANRRRILESLIDFLSQKEEYPFNLEQEEVIQIVIKQTDALLMEFLTKNT
ncbi:MAG: FRG domain-containing protein [Gammaproteobacteria bacterium AqS3]|nr:FRG domain-containing protein [Gammaproteobacteria bacterium AqS3]